MSIKAKRNLKLVICIVCTLALVSAVGFCLYYLLGITGLKIKGYYAVVILSTLLILLSEATYRVKLMLVLFVVFLPFFGIALSLFLWVFHKPKRISESTKVGLYVDKQPFLQNSNEQLFYFDEGLKLWQDIISELKCAKEEVLIFTYIFKSGRCAAELYSLLFELLNRGVKVYFYVDWFGSGNILKEDQIKALIKRGAKVKVKNKPFLLFLPKDNKRTHAKVIIIDKKVVYTGSMNICDEGVYRDKNCGVKAKGDITYIYNAFCELWGLAKVPCDQYFGKVFPVLFYNQANLEEIFISLILKAEKSVTIITPYLSFSSEMFMTLRRARGRGVNITVVVPSKKSPSRRDMVTSYCAEKLSSISVNVKSYNGRFIHSKALITDEKTAITGSCNFDIRSGKYAVESSLITCDNGLIDGLLCDFNNILKDSSPIYYKKNYGKKLLGKIFRLIAPLV